MPNHDPSPSTRFQPGASGNPGGRPKGGSLTATLRDRIEDTTKEGVRTFRQALVDRLLVIALDPVGDKADALRAIREVFLRLDGPPARPEADGNAFLNALELAESVDADFVPDAPPGPAAPQE